MNLQAHRSIERGDQLGRIGIGTLLVKADCPDRIIASAQEFAWIDEKGKLRFANSKESAIGVQNILRELAPELYKDTGLVFLRHRNAYVNTGLNNALDREHNGTGTTVGFIGVSSNTTAVTAATVNLNGASGGSAANTIIKASTNVRSSQTTTDTVTSPFVNGDFTSGVFVWNKIGLLNTSTDAGTGLIDVIGGTGGSSPYNRTFSLDLTGAGSFSVTAAIAVTATAV